VRLHANGLIITEEPIHFYNRHSGKSKIPSLEIFRGIFKLMQLFLGSFINAPKEAASQLIEDQCLGCEQKFLFELSPKYIDGGAIQSNSKEHISNGHKLKKAQCLFCGLEQMTYKK